MAQRELVIGGEAALRYWRGIRLGVPSDADFSKPYGAPNRSLSEQISLAQSVCHSDHIDAIVTSAAARPKADSLACRVWTGALPSEKLVLLGSGVKVCKPELAFMQLAKDHDVIDLAAIAYELVGTYTIASWEDGSSVSLPDSLLKLEDLTGYAQTCRIGKIHGAARALEALRLVVEGSNSPAETKVAIIMSLSRKQGGYGLSGFEMNPRIELSKRGAQALGRKTMRPDFLWRKRRIALEYDSDERHLDSKSHAEDSRRRIALNASGYKVTTLTKEQAKSPSDLDSAMGSISEELGIRRRPATSTMDSRLADVHSRLFLNPFDPLDEGLA